MNPMSEAIVIKAPEFTFPIALMKGAQSAIDTFTGGLSTQPTKNAMHAIVAVSAHSFFTCLPPNQFLKTQKRHTFTAASLVPTEGPPPEHPQQLMLVGHDYRYALCKMPDGSTYEGRLVIVGTEEDLPLPDDYHIKRLITEAQYVD